MLKKLSEFFTTSRICTLGLLIALGGTCGLGLYDIFSGRCRIQPKAAITVQQDPEVTKKLEQIEQKLETLQKSVDTFQKEYLQHVEAKRIQFWPGNKPLSYERFYATVWKVLTDAPVSFKDKKGLAALIIETAATESFFGATVVQTKGVALGVFQMEPRTYKCVCDNFLAHNKRLELFVRRYKDKKSSDEVNLKNNLPYQVALCLAQYVRYGVHKKDLSDRSVRAYWYKKIWNTEKGKGSVSKFAEDTQKYLNKWYS